MPIKVGYRGYQLMMSAAQCACGARHNAITQDVFVDAGLLSQLPELIAQRELGRLCALITDGPSAQYAQAAQDALTARGYKVSLCAAGKGPLVPDERALGAALMSMSMDTEFILAVGGEAACDVARAVAAQTERPLAVVPTALSSSAYVGLAAHLVRCGEARRVPSICPELVVCDLDVLAETPMELLLAGALDLVGKYTARLDWACARNAKGEQFCDELAQAVAFAANKALKRTKEIANRDPAGIKALTESLLLCGMASVVEGGSRPVEGTEQLVCDAWADALRAECAPVPPRGLLVGASALALMEGYAALADDEKAQRKLTPEARDALAALPDPRRVRDALAPLGDIPAPPPAAASAAKQRAAKSPRDKHSPIRLLGQKFM